MNIRKLPSGNYQIRIMENGQTYSLTVDHKPTEMEAFKLITAAMPKSKEKYTLKDACEAYLDAKKDIMSDTTIRGYRVLIRQIDPVLAKTKLNLITKPMVQAEINRYSVGHAPKTAKNFGSFIISVLDFHGYEITRIRYPQQVKVENYLPTVDEVKAILEELKGTRYYVPVFLGSRGLRVSEVCGLEITDLSDDNYISITKAKVRGERKYVVKTTKTTSSNRKIAIPAEIADIIRSQGYIYDGKKPDMINRYLKKVEKRLGIPHFTFHQLRHFFASYTHYMGFVDKAIQEDAGWADDKTMKRVYRQGMNQEEVSRQISDLLKDTLL